MKIISFKDEESWLESRRGRITGTRLGNLFSKRDKKPLKGYYELIAERVAIPATDEAVMDRGIRLEEEAIIKFAEQTGKKITNELVLWHRDDDENIAISPDGVISNTEAVEVKCLNSASHIEAWLTKEVPSEYEFQVLQYFIVNEQLKTLYFVFYDPRMPKSLFSLEVKRESVQEKVDEYLVLERRALEEVTKIEESLTF